jgi:hypothetical protein
MLQGHKVKSTNYKEHNFLQVGFCNNWICPPRRHFYLYTDIKQLLQTLFWVLSSTNQMPGSNYQATSWLPNVVNDKKKNPEKSVFSKESINLNSTL